MEVNFLRLGENDDGKWGILLCRTASVADETLDLGDIYDTAGDALNGALKWCADRGLSLNTYLPMGVFRGLTRRDDVVVEASHRFGETKHPHPSQMS